jgi:uncharacterized repeat protein (TIGR03803 family)
MRAITRIAVFLIVSLPVASQPAFSQPALEVLAHFSGDAGSPRAGLLLASDGYLYGTTISGGDFGLGSVFRVQPGGSGFQVLHSFAGTDGASPSAGLIEFAGALYGTTTWETFH